MNLNRESLELTKSEYNAVMGDITLIDGDASLCALFRAIVINHLSPEDVDSLQSKIAIKFKRQCVDSSDDILELYNACKVPFLIIETTSFDNITIDSDEWKTFDKAPCAINQLLSQFAKSKVFINEKDKAIIAVVHNYASSLWAQALGSMLCGLLRWYYPKLTPEERAFFKTISVGVKDIKPEDAELALKKYVEDAAKKIDLQTAKLKALLKGAGSVTRDTQIRTQEKLLEESRRQVASYMDSVRSLYSKIEAAELLLNSLENAEVTSDEEFFEFFNQHKNVHVMSRERDGHDLLFEVVDTLEFYDDAEMGTLFDNSNSWWRRKISALHMQYKYLKQIFVNRQGLFRVSAAFALCDLRMISMKKNLKFEHDAMPNYHIYGYGCGGGNSIYYERYAESGDWQLAIEQSIAATKNFNTGDSTVGKSMLDWISSNKDVKCIYVKDDLSPVTNADVRTAGVSLVSFNEFMAKVDASDVKKAKKE